MRYLYKCDDCHTQPIIVNKSMVLSSRVETCTCGNVMKRVYNSVATITSDGHKSAKS